MQGGLRPIWLAICQYGWNQPDNYMKEQLSEEYTNHVPVAYTCTGGYRELFVSFENIFVESVQVLCLVKSGDVTLPSAAIQGMESKINFEEFFKDNGWVAHFQSHSVPLLLQGSRPEASHVGRSASAFDAFACERGHLPGGASVGWCCWWC